MEGVLGTWIRTYAFITLSIHNSFCCWRFIASLMAGGYAPTTTTVIILFVVLHEMAMGHSLIYYGIVLFESLMLTSLGRSPVLIITLHWS